MGERRCYFALFSLLVISFTAGCFQHRTVSFGPPPVTPQLWYWHHSYLVTDEAYQKSCALLDKAAAAGYTGLALWDSGLNYVGNPSWPAKNETYMREFLKYAAAKRMRIIAAPSPYGFSNEALEMNPNWAESQRVIGAQFEVDRSGTKLNFRNSFPGLANGGFENGEADWFSTGDQGLGLNSTAHSGKNSAVIVDAPRNARLRQKFPLQPWRQYHLRLFFKSSNFHGAPMISVFDSGDLKKVRFNVSLHANGTHDWTQLDYTFNSQDSTEGYLYFGVWGGSSGLLWFDDVSLEETALVYLTRRPGTPVRVYDPVQPGLEFIEGKDFNAITDARMQISKPFTDDYHQPTPITLPQGTRLKPGQKLSIDFYAVITVPGLHSVSLCLTDPASTQWVAKNGQAIHQLLPPDSGLFLGYDEIRQANSCGSCRSRQLSAGQLLAWNVRQTISAYNSVAPNHPLYIWNDMFDPYHNAHANYFYVEGDLAGSWSGIPASVTVMNWNLDHLHDSLVWFSGTDAKQPTPHAQIIAGYYDTGNGTAAAQQELQAATGAPGILGFMYTTWNDDYSQLASFAAAAKSGWYSYRSSLSNE
ncbi:MAG: hypothetical protein ACJ73N_05010 [Bryobacteraceae bacterium]